MSQRLGSLFGSRDWSWSASPDVRAHISPDSSILLDTRHGQCHALNRFGAHIWTMLAGQGGLSETMLVATLRHDVENVPDSFESDVTKFLQDLYRKIDTATS
jgi:hypothetical protein